MRMVSTSERGRGGWTAVLLAAAMVATSVLVATPAAQAATVEARGEAKPTVTVRPGGPGTYAVGDTVATIERVPSSPRPAGDDDPQIYPGWDVCAFEMYGYRGWVICRMDWSAITWVSGTDTYEEVFVIGTDWSVWHIWRGSGGWKSLGGRALAEIGNGAFADVNPVRAMTFGLDADLWCRYRGTGNWAGGWSRC
ncbi:hypothetical protein [Plantactinospora sp. ZYX-F-223]|uniref:hypothetical protein n=1 Tax=Plantactinospora sp. ZYX-F-223 TaxID=3144103 RepID=UPI0031FC1334